MKLSQAWKSKLQQSSSAKFLKFNVRSSIYMHEYTRSLPNTEVYDTKTPWLLDRKWTMLIEQPSLCLLISAVQSVHACDLKRVRSE
jgi:hypothetical protein